MYKIIRFVQMNASVEIQQDFYVIRFKDLSRNLYKHYKKRRDKRLT